MRWTAGLVAGALVGSVATCAGLIGIAALTAGAPPTSAQAEQRAAAPELKRGQIVIRPMPPFGSPFTVGGLRYTIVGVQEGAVGGIDQSITGRPEPTTGTLVPLRYSAENMGAVPVTHSPYALSLLDAANRRFDASERATQATALGAGLPRLPTEIPPGVTREFAVVFEVAPDFTEGNTGIAVPMEGR